MIYYRVHQCSSLENLLENFSTSEVGKEMNLLTVKKDFEYPNLQGVSHQLGLGV
jgi:hypothetical protein